MSQPVNPFPPDAESDENIYVVTQKVNGTEYVSVQLRTDAESNYMDSAAYSGSTDLRLYTLNVTRVA
jgi:hypothetical protein